MTWSNLGRTDKCQICHDLKSREYKTLNDEGIDTEIINIGKMAVLSR